MTDVAGLVVGVVAAWSTCVQVFDIVDSGKGYGMDYELLRIKLEVERIRLLAWGEAVGLVGVGHGPDPRLNREDYCSTVLRLLGCVQHIFENTAKLQEVYGLRPTAPNVSDRQNNDLCLAQQPIILGLVFKRAYESLRRSAKDRQRTAPLGKKALWAIRDKKKFQDMVFEIKGFNDDLESLFPDVKLKSRNLIRTDIDESEEVQDLRLVQQATEGAHEDISDTASMRLAALGTARSVVSGGAQAITVAEELLSDNPWSHQLPQPGGDGADQGNPSSGSGRETNQASKDLEAVELYIRKKRTGALSLSLCGPDSFSAKVEAVVGWEGMQRGGGYGWDKVMGYVKMSHPSFDLYRRKKFIKRLKSGKYNISTDEDNILLDVESDAKYENINPGTVTAEGFAFECWDYEERYSRRGVEFTEYRSYDKIPDIPPKKFLRRLDELRRGRPTFGWKNEVNFQEFAGGMGIDQPTAAADDRAREVILFLNLYGLLNRQDIVTDFTSGSSIAVEFTRPKGDSIRLWNFLWQIIITTELAWRLKSYPDSYTQGFTPKVLASLIVARLWLRNVDIILGDDKSLLADIKKPESPQEEAKAEDFKSRGNEAVKNKQYQKAVDLYNRAIEIGGFSAIYHANRSAALLPIGKFKEACDDAYIATQLDPKYAKAWSRLGIAHLNLGNWKQAQAAYQRAIEVAGGHATDLMWQGLSHAEAKIDEELEAIEKETDLVAKNVLWKNFHDQDWDITHKRLSFHSRVHEQQAEGLLIFAQRLKWPFINEMRDFAEDAYTNLQGGQTIPWDLFDWLFGLTLPGMWLSHKIMTALILCTPSIAAEVATAFCPESGLVLPKKTYWRVRSVLGRVLGCLPRVISLCGWIGPCPPVEFAPPLAESKPRHIRLNARPVALREHTPESDGYVPPVFRAYRRDLLPNGQPIARMEHTSESGADVFHFLAPGNQSVATQNQPDEEPQPYMAEMKDPRRWVVPEPPVREVGTCSIQAIQLRKQPLDVNAAVIDGETEPGYKAMIVFKMDSIEDPITYKLHTNPVFVTLPPCYSKQGPHEVHLREIPSYQNNIWTTERLGDHKPEDFDDDDVMVINATGTGAEVLARAWCSEHGKHAAIRRSGGPCYVCAFRAAGKSSLGVGILIWVS